METYKHGELIIASMTIILAIAAILVPFIWNSHRARRRDFKEAMDTKADEIITKERMDAQKELVKEQLHSQSLKIVMQATRLDQHEISNQTQFVSHNTEMLQVNKTMAGMSKRIDEILIIVSNKN